MDIIKNTDRLVLGTVQLGLNYGIANISGKPDLSEAMTIIKEAYNRGIREFDTAQVYGDSEKVLGRILTTLDIAKDVRITSKFRPDIDITDSELLKESLSRSLDNLKIPKLHCIMFHRESILNNWSKSLKAALQTFISNGMVDNIGVSVSSPVMAVDALGHRLIKAVQVPSNILDRRFEDFGVFDLAEKYSKMIYVRSIFLQGLLTMNQKALPGKMKFAENTLKKLDRFIEEKQVPREVVLLGYPRETYQNAKIIFGAETAEQVRSNVHTWNLDIDKRILEDVRSEFVDTDEKLLNPALWPQ